MGDAIGVPIYYLGSYRFSCVYLSGTGHGLFFKYLIILFRGGAPAAAVVSSAIVNGFSNSPGVNARVSYNSWC